MKPKSGSPKPVRMPVKINFSQFAFNDGSSEQVKFDLYLKSREIKQISQLLQKTLPLQKAQRQQWIEENEDFINQLLNSFMDDSMMVLDGIKMDTETMELSVNLISDLRDAVTIIQNLLHDGDKYQS